jgi:cell division inhibitor SepF
MEELETNEKRSLLSRLFSRHNEDPFEDYEPEVEAETGSDYLRVHHTTQYMVRIRRQVVSFEEALAAADGLKRGEQQILNIASAEPTLREKIKDLLSGVNYSQEGTWEEVGQHVYILAPGSALVESVPATPRIAAQN